MDFTRKEALELLSSLHQAGARCLAAAGISKHPQNKRRPWRSPGGPEGLGLHYTGGPDGLRSLRWFNDPRWGNTGSSNHVVVFDRIIPEWIDLWPALEAAAVFPVPVICHFDDSWGSWNINWANGRLLGLENRNCGYHGYQKLPGGLAQLKKRGVQIGGRTYEEFTREQIEANILIGRMWRAIRGEVFRPEWICGHYQIWATKHDPGPAYPTMHQMRQAIFSAVPLADIPWLDRYPSAGDEAAEPLPQGGEEAGDDQRGDPLRTEPRWDAPQYARAPRVYEQEAQALLYRLGWPTGPEALNHRQLVTYISYFQRSTVAWRAAKRPDRVLAVDGIAGPKTLAALCQRVEDLRLRDIPGTLAVS